MVLRLTPLPSSDSAVRELLAVREIVRAFLTADHPREVFQFALERVSPLVGASFASVFLVDGASELMKLAAAYNWPERYRPFLGEMRVRVGQGPSGEAVSERRVIQIPDVFADPSLAEWQDVARELGFKALVALPLITGPRVLGAVTFYFDRTGGFGAETRGLLRIVADQMAATAEKAALIDELRRANAALVETNAEMERQYVALLEARRIKDEFLANISHELRTPLTAVIGYVSLMEEGLAGPLTAEQKTSLRQVGVSSARLLELIEGLLDLTAIRRGEAEVLLERFDPREALADAVRAAGPLPPGTMIEIEEPATMLPAMRTDRRKLVRILTALLGNACKFAPGTITASVAVRDRRVFYTIRDRGPGISSSDQDVIFEEFRQVDGSATRRHGGAGLGLALARRLARLLRGDIEVLSALGEGSAFTVGLPLDLQLEDAGARID